jgi:hypothetical protein
MPALVAPSRVACKPMPFLLRDQFEAIGQLAVVSDDRWDEMVEMMRAWTFPDKDVIIIETDHGPFMVIPDGVIDRDAIPDGDSHTSAFSHQVGNRTKDDLESS